MPKLGDGFPLEHRKEHVEGALRPGMILYLDAAFTDPPKPKYVLVACLEPTPVLLLINSRLNPNVESDPARAGCHLRLNASDYPFLDHDSFLDCSKAYNLADDTEVAGQLVADLNRIKGEIRPDDRRHVIELVRSSHSLSPRIRKAIEAGMSGGPESTP
jgi:hypothetical protein